jgi:DNA-binding PadR family transcriptional regulator
MENNWSILKHRAIIKLYLLKKLEERKTYGLDLLDTGLKELREYGVNPGNSEIYKILHDMVHEGILYRTKKLKGGDPKKDFQEIVIYQFTEDGLEKAKHYRARLKKEIDRCMRLLQKTLKDNY